MSLADSLDKHESHRRAGIGCVSLLVGPYCATWAALKIWAGNHSRPMAIARAPGLCGALVAYADALLQLQGLQSAILAAVSPRTTDQPVLDQQTWQELTPVERSAFLAGWAVDETMRGIARKLLVDQLGNASQPILATIDDLRSVAELLGRLISLPVLVAVPADDTAMQGLGYLLDIADQVPAIPLVLLLDGTAFNVIRDAADQGDRVAAFLLEGAVAINDLSMPGGNRAPRLTSIPSPLMGQIHNLEAQGVEERVLDAFISASTINPDSEPERFDSRAEQFLSMLLEGDPRTASLFTPQGEPGFLMNNNQPAMIDFLCRSLRIAIEVDGPHHLEAEQFRRDRRKDRELQKAGYLILRFLAEDVTARFEEVREQVLAAVAWRIHAQTEP